MCLVGRNGGYCVDVGCNRPVYNNNTWYLEEKLGFTVTAIDAIDYSDEYRKVRPKTAFICSLVDEVEGTRTFYHATGADGWEDQVSSLYEASLSMGKTFSAMTENKMAKPLSILVENIPSIDVLFIDVEGHELPVLKSLDWKSQKPRCIVVENNGKFVPRHKVEEYLLDREYRLAARIGLSDDIYVPRH